MSLLRKFFGISQNVITEKVEKIVDNTTDIKREGNAIVKSIENKIAVIKSRVEEAQVEVCKAKNEIESLEHKNKLLETAAKKFANSGDDEKALQALGILENNELTIESLKLTVNILEPVINQQISYIQKLVSEKNTLKAEILRLDMEEKAYKLKASMLGTSSNDKVNGFNIQDLRDKMQKAKAEVEAKEIISDKLGENLDTTKLESPKQSLQDRLNALKKSDA